MERCVIEFERNDSIHDSKKKNHGLFLAYFGFVTDQDSRIIYFINHRECFFFFQNIERDTSLRTYECVLDFISFASSSSSSFSPPL